MDTVAYRAACRLAHCTAAMAAMLLAPVVLQAAMILQPHTFAAGHAGIVMSLALAGTVVAVPAMLAALFRKFDEREP